MGVRHAILPPRHQVDAAISQANPVSAFLYPVLATTRNVRIISIEANVTWGGNQPQLWVDLTIDGQLISFGAGTPVSTQRHFAENTAGSVSTQQTLTTTDYIYRSFLIEGRSVKIDARYIGAAGTTLLECRVKWAKW
jgi:hypothetical protein